VRRCPHVEGYTNIFIFSLAILYNHWFSSNFLTLAHDMGDGVKRYGITMNRKVQKGLLPKWYFKQPKSSRRKLIVSVQSIFSFIRFWFTLKLLLDRSRIFFWKLLMFLLLAIASIWAHKIILSVFSLWVSEGLGEYFCVLIFWAISCLGSIVLYLRMYQAFKLFCLR